MLKFIRQHVRKSLQAIREQVAPINVFVYAFERTLISRFTLDIPVNLDQISIDIAINPINAQFEFDLSIEQSNPDYLLEFTFNVHNGKTPFDWSFDVVRQDFLAPLLISAFGAIYKDGHWTPLEKSRETRKPILDRSQSSSSFDVLPQILAPRSANPPSPWQILLFFLRPPVDFETNPEKLLPHPLYPYQKEGVHFLFNRLSALLADDMGTGKTVMSTVALTALMIQGHIRRALILCPLSILMVWENHISEWSKNIILGKVRGTKTERSAIWKDNYHVYLTTYDTLKNDIEDGTLPQDKRFFDLILIDEAHHIRNRDTKRFKMLRKLEAKYRWGLTGTPIQNRIEELHTLFDFLAPSQFKLEDFPEHMPQKVQAKIAPYFLRRRKDEVMKDLPPLTHQDFWLELGDKQKKEYFGVEDRIYEKVQQVKLNRAAVQAHIMTLMQLCNFSTSEGSSSKLDLLKNQIEDVREGSQKALVFSMFVEQGVSKVLDALIPYGAAHIKGGMSDMERRKQVEAFQTNPQITVMVASVRAAGEGLTLTQASYVVHFDHWWNPAVMWQAESRAHRRGQTRPVNVYSYWTRDTVEERVYALLQKKGLLFNQLFNQNILRPTDGELESIFTDEDLMMLLTPKRYTK